MYIYIHIYENIHSRIYTYIYAGIATAALSFNKPNKLNNI